MDAPPTTTPQQAAPRPTTWLQYLIVYPTLALSLTGAIPTALQHIKAWRLETTASKVQLVEEQQKLWERNLECIQQGTGYEVDGPHGIIVRVTLCQSTGDTLLKYHVNQWGPIYKWVALPVEKIKR